MAMQVLPGTDNRRRITLMRHGHVDYFTGVLRHGSADKVPLTEQGQAEARAAGVALSHVTFDRALCSGLPRARETAELVLAQQDPGQSIPVLEDDADLREIRAGAGAMRHAIDDLRELARQLAARFGRAHEPGAAISDTGEAFSDAYERAVTAIERHLADPSWHSALIVAHEGINRLLLGWATGGGLQAVGAFEQDTACVNILDLDMSEGPDGHFIGRRIIKAVNLTPYNYVKHGMNLTSLEAIFSR